MRQLNGGPIRDESEEPQALDGGELLGKLVGLLLADLDRERERLATLVDMMADAPQASCADVLGRFAEVAFWGPNE